MRALMKSRLFAFAVFKAVFAIFAAVFFAAPPLFGQIAVTNLSDGETLSYSLALLEGTTEPGAERIVVENLSSSSGERILTGQAVAGRFKILAPLEPGENRLVLSTEKSRLDFSLVRRVSERERFVRLIGLIDPDAPDLAEPEYRALAGRMATAALLLQTAVAERMNDLGFGRRTFALEPEPGSIYPAVHLLRAARSISDSRRLESSALFDSIYREMSVRWPDDKARNLVVLNFARHGDTAASPLFSAASGGGHLALIGFATFGDWPASIGGVYAALTDETPLERGDSSSGEPGCRLRRAAAVSTTLGAALHELGHTFGLADAPEDAPKLDWMRQGFVHFGRVFLVEEPASAISSERRKITPDDEPAFFGENAQKLAESPWLNDSETEE